MQNLFDDLKKLLSQDNRFMVEGSLLKNKIVELALQVDAGLMKILLSNESMKKHFFQEVEGVFVFDKIKFQKFVSNKSFLPDSYTSFKNKIGLTTDDDFISESKEVVLSWPYKDCVLEGGQTKEDAKRNEIFWNETLAPDQIDRLLSPKALTNFKKYNKDGNQTISTISKADNLLIKGNNLLVLKSLEKIYGNQIDFIYFDPPYNTENDGFLYNDTFSHSTWLTYIKNRLSVAKNLLSKGGLIFISCDDNEQPYLKVLCDEVFGRDNFIACLPTIMNLKGNNDQFGFSGTHEYTLVFTRNKNFCKINEFEVEEEDSEAWQSDEIGYFKKGAPLRATGDESTREDRPKMFYPILVDLKAGNVSTIEKEEFEKIYNQSENTFDDDWIVKLKTKYEKLGHSFILPMVDKSTFGRWRWGYSDTNKEKLKTDVIFNETKNGITLYKKQRPELNELPSKKPKTLFYKPEYSSGNGTSQLKAFFGEKVFKNPKPVDLIIDFVHLATNKESIVLDFTGGSGTTAQAVLDLNAKDFGNRRFILVEQMDYIESITSERIKKVLIKNGANLNNGTNSFVFIELAKANKNFIEQINSAKDRKELKEVWTNIQEKAFLSFNVNPKLIDENAKEFEQLSFENQQRFLIDVLDKNMLYIPYSEIADDTYGISKEEIELNKKFYSQK